MALTLAQLHVVLHITYGVFHGLTYDVYEHKKFSLLLMNRPDRSADNCLPQAREIQSQSWIRLNCKS